MALFPECISKFNYYIKLWRENLNQIIIFNNTKVKQLELKMI